jgi:hypothetical protein
MEGDFGESLAKFRQEAAAARALGRCVICGQEAAPKIYSEAGRREYEISGSCERCFDEMFAEDEEDEG